MKPINELMKRKGFVAGLAVFCILAAAVVYLGFSVRRLNLALKDKAGSLDQVNKSEVTLKISLQKAQNELAAAKKDYEQLKTEREQLYVQAKGLLADRERASRFEGELNSAKAEIESLRKKNSALESEKQGAAVQSAALKEKTQTQDAFIVQVAKERDQARASLEELRDKSGVRRLEQENAALKKQRDAAAEGMKKAEAEKARLREEAGKLQDERQQLSKKLDRSEDEYTDALKKNRSLEQSVINAPTKCAEIARQNQILVRRTANMHYNMGVFYTKQKEYGRAIAEFERAIELAPSDSYSYFNLGYIYAEYLDSKSKAIEYFRRYLQYAKKDDKDVDWAKKYIITWQTWEGKQPID